MNESQSARPSWHVHISIILVTLTGAGTTTFKCMVKARQPVFNADSLNKRMDICICIHIHASILASLKYTHTHTHRLQAATQSLFTSRKGGSIVT